MATFQSRIEDLVGTFSDTTALDQWLTDDARKLVDIIPVNKAENYVTSTTIGSGIVNVNYRLIRVTGGGYRSKEVDSSLETQTTLTGSLFKATQRDPSHYIKEGYLYAFPTSITRYAYRIAYPTVLYSDSTISVLPEQLIDALIFSVASR